MSVNNLIQDLMSLENDTEIEMFELTEFDQQSFGDVFRFSAYSGVIFQGNSYNPLPCELEGLEYRSEGTLPRPKLKVADVGQLISGLIDLYGGIEGSRLTIRKTLKRFLDTEATADPTAEKPFDVFLVSQMLQFIPGKYIELELCADFDFVDETLPRRVASRTCTWKYRGSECGYTGRGYTINNVPTLDPNQDVCGKNIDACQKRFGKNSDLPYGGFPGLSRR